MEQTIERIPTWALCYINYGDPTALTDEEIALVDEWQNRNNVADVCTAYTEGEKPQPYFTHNPAFGLPTEVMDCYIIYR